ncbi:MAG: hypothetical protein R3F19_26880 [Verrucomicrobiales bacterium]
MKSIAIIYFAFVAMVAAQDLDLANVKELQKDDRPVSPEQMTALIGEADRVVVTESPMKDAKKLFESRERKDLDALSTALVVVKPDEWFHCMCIGTPAIYLYKDDKLLAQISNHHGQSVRCSLWGSDAPISDTEKWLKWFDDRKIDGPRKEVEEMRESQEQGERDWKRWISAMPKALKPIWEDSLGQFGDVNTAPLAKALRESIPKNVDQILALLRWFGSGAGPWSGFPSYESAAEELLLEYQIAEIVSAIENKDLSPEQLEGAARLFGGWDFSQKHPKGLEQVPADIKQSLWDHVKDTKDEDKLGRATRAFKPKG